MLHYTLNTAHTRVSSRSEVADDVLTMMRPLVAAGRHKMPIAGYTLHVTHEGAGLLATVYRGDDPLATIAIAPDDASAPALWRAIESLYLSITDRPGFRSADMAAPRCPASTPWCAAMLFIPSAPESAWLGDFERCLAWTWIEQS